MKEKAIKPQDHSEERGHGVQLPGAVLLDMDGTLIDSEPIWYQAEVEYCAQHGSTWSVEQATRCVGKPLVETGRMIAQWTGSGDTAEAVAEYLTSFVVTRLGEQSLPWRPGAEELLIRLGKNEVPIALVTSSPGRIAVAALHQIPDGTFTAVVSGDDVTELKPSPEPYLRAMSILGVTAAETIVVEDSPSGIASGRAAGANVVAVPCMLPIQASAEISRMRSLEQMTDSVLARLVAGEKMDSLS